VTRVALDSNILAYLAGVDRAPNDASKIASCHSLVERLSSGATLVAPVQCLGELYNVLLKAGESRDDARATVRLTGSGLETPSSRPETLDAALALATDPRLQFWDALILCAAADAGCSVLVSEDMQPGFTARGVVVVDPFAPVLNPRLARLLA
jgi:predicted nucleic acid-binding protein